MKAYDRLGRQRMKHKEKNMGTNPETRRASEQETQSKTQMGKQTWDREGINQYMTEETYTEDMTDCHRRHGDETKTRKHNN